MDGFLDIYSKLIIAIISFIAPLIVYLLSVFSEGINMVRRRTETERNQILVLLSAQLDFRDNTSADTKMVENSNKKLKSIEKINEIKCNLLTPTRQIYRIFLPLFLSLLFIMLYKLANDPYIITHHRLVCELLLIGSVIFFISGIFIIKQVAWTIIEAKQMIASQRTDIPVGQQRD